MPKILPEIDTNFASPKGAGKGLSFWNADEAPFRLYGLLLEKDGYARIPLDVAEAVNPGTVYLRRNTAGGRVRFVTDSRRIAVKVDMPFSLPLSHMPLTGFGGFDLYRDGSFFRTFIPPMSAEMEYVFEIDVYARETHEYEINFPLYHDVNHLLIGLEPDAKKLPGKDYDCDAPVVFYGSSITQGACASRPGTCYVNILSRALNTDIVNLGFAGSAKGELAMADYIAGLNMRAFVCDYDYNAPTADHLRKTHWPFVERIHKARPDLPIILMSRPDVIMPFPHNTPVRASIVLETYNKLKALGDDKVWFIDGSVLWAGNEWHGCTVDGCHPNDLGFFRMAEAIKPVLMKALKQ